MTSASPFGIDIEATGPSTNDVFFAFGAAWIDPGAEGIKFHSLDCALNLEKPADVSWEEYWVQKGWDMDTYTVFWSKRLDVLNDLQNPTKILMLSTLEDFALRVHEILMWIEKIHPKPLAVSDTQCFDVPVTNELLRKFDHQPIGRTRTGGYLPGENSDSYIMGLGYFTPDTPYAKVAAFKEKIRALVPMDVVYDHRPANDAKYILRDFVAATKYADNARILIFPPWSVFFFYGVLAFLLAALVIYI